MMYVRHGMLHSARHSSNRGACNCERTQGTALPAATLIIRLVGYETVAVTMRPPCFAIFAPRSRLHKCYYWMDFGYQQLSMGDE